MYKCRECGSTNVEQKAWVKINEPKLTVITDFFGSGDKEDNWCNDCHDHRYIEEDDKHEKIYS